MVGVFGSMWTTAATATYLGAVFDMLALFFLLGSFLALLSERRGSMYFSAVLLVLALRSKEFAIVAPVLCAILAAFSSSRPTPRETLISVARRTWIHFLIGIVFAAIYARLRGDYGSSNLYSLQVDARTILASLSYYTALIFGNEETVSPFATAILAAGFMAIGVYAVVRRRLAMLFCLAAYVLTLLPVSMLPKMRAPIYAYAPQMFLFPLIVLLLDSSGGSIETRNHPMGGGRWYRRDAHVLGGWFPAESLLSEPDALHADGSESHHEISRGCNGPVASDQPWSPDLRESWPEYAVVVRARAVRFSQTDHEATCDRMRDPSAGRKAPGIIPERHRLKFLLNYHPDGSWALIEKSPK